MNLTRLAAACSAALLFTVGLCIPASGLVQRNALMITSPHVALDLKLSKKQTEDRDQLMSAYQHARNEVDAGFEKATTDEQREALGAEIAKQQDELDAKLLALLTPAQTNRLRQISIQQEGVAAMQDEGVAAELALTAAQRGKVKAVCEASQKALDDYQAALGDAIAKIPEPGADEAAIKAYAQKQQAVITSMKPRERQYLAAKAAAEKQALATLTPAQRKKWSAMQGKPLKAG